MVPRTKPRLRSPDEAGDRPVQLGMISTRPAEEPARDSTAARTFILPEHYYHSARAVTPGAQNKGQAGGQAQASGTGKSPDGEDAEQRRAARDQEAVLETRIETTFKYHGGLAVQNLPLQTPVRPSAEPTEHRWARLEHLGAGGFGTVYLQRCKPKFSQKLYRAVKQLSKPRGQNVLDVKDFARELSAATSLSKPEYEYYFVKSLGWYEDHSFLYIAMEYLPLGDLESHLMYEPKIYEEEAKAIMRQTLTALKFMHEKALAHRDLKPANILIKQKPPGDWWVKLGDFGISRRFQESTNISATVCGTLDFMAPELHRLIAPRGLSDLERAQRADIWAAGETAFRVLTRKSSFGGDLRRLFDYVEGRAEFPREHLLASGASSSAGRFIDSLMAPEPAARPSVQTAAAHPWLQRPNALAGLSLSSSTTLNCSGPTVTTAPSAFFSPDGEVVVLATKTVLYLVEADTGRRLATYKDANADFASGAFHPNGVDFAVAAKGDPTLTPFVLCYSFDLTVRIKTVDQQRSYFGDPRGTCEKLPPSLHPLVVYSPDEERIAFSNRYGIAVWDFPMSPGEKPTNGIWPGSGTKTMAMCFTPSGKRLVTAGKTEVSIWGLKRHEGTLLQRIPCLGGTLNIAVACPERGRLMVAAAVLGGDGIRDGYRDVYACVWDERVGCWVRRYVQKAPQQTKRQYIRSSIAFSPDGTLLATLLGGGVTVWAVDAADERGWCQAVDGRVARKGAAGDGGVMVDESFASVVFSTHEDSDVLAVTSVYKAGRAMLFRLE
ncbi:hypothetical protein RB595_003396 [Gaeumannomyces hyphopodioides]